MDLQEFIDRERREAAAKAEEEKNKLSDQLKATVAERDKKAAELDKIKIDQRNYQELTSILIDKNLFDELKHAAEDEAYRESLYVEFGVKSVQD